MTWSIGVDVGGTFTDFFAVDQAGGACVYKRPSTPGNPAEAVLAGLRELSAAHGIPLDRVGRFAHGTTVATNALIQRRGKPVALITTRGFRDLLEIGRQVRPHLYDLQRDQSEPLVPRERRFEVTERMDATGAVHRPLDLDDLDRAIQAVRQSGARAVAVGFLFAYLNPTHEQIAARRLAERLPEVAVSLSSAVQPEFREYERFVTTVINAYLQPVLGDYIGALERELGQLLPNASLGINQSSGGLMSLARARHFPVRTALSGPAAGAVGATEIARLSNRLDAITIDVGGTSADVAVIRGGAVDVAFGREVDGFPIRLPMVDIATIGAGGGSIAWFDRDGLLKVGPQSAGAAPGPACYAQGGTEATLSDANLVLGRLPTQLLDGRMRLDPTLAHAAIARLAESMGKSVEDTAHGIVDIAVANMVRAIRTISVERGHDPRAFALMPFGGAGPLHARDIAAALGMREILVPPAPGILCAQGLLVADLREDFVSGGRLPVDADLAPVVAALTARAEAWFATEKLGDARRDLSLALDMRHVGQNFELTVPIALDPLPDPDALRQRFFAAHDQAYGFHDAAAPVEIISCRLTARAKLWRPTTAPPPPVGATAPKPSGERRISFARGETIPTPVHRRDALAPGQTIPGPAAIDQLDATALVYPGDTARVDDARNLLIEVRS